MRAVVAISRSVLGGHALRGWGACTFADQRRLRRDDAGGAPSGTAAQTETAAEAQTGRTGAQTARPARPGTGRGPEQDLLDLQATGGNAMVGRLLRSAEPGADRTSAPSDDVAQRIRSRLGGGEQISDGLRERFAPVVGSSLDGVRLHHDTEAADLAGAVGARAFTTGTDVFFGAGAYDPDSQPGATLLAHELAHTTQRSATPSGSEGGAMSVSDPADRDERAADQIARRLDTGATAPQTAAAANPAAATGTLTIARWADDGAGLPEKYAGLLQPSLSEAEAQLLHQATGGVGLVETIRRRDDLRSQLNDIANGANRGDVAEAQAFHDYARLEPVESRLTGEIDAQLAELGISDERELFRLVNDRFPTFFLAEAKRVALEMLAQNEQEARDELARYSEAVCSPDIDGLLAADRALGEQQEAINRTDLSIKTAERALSLYAPIAGVYSNEELATLIPENELSVMVDIGNLDTSRARLAEEQALYNATRFGYGRSYPILLSSEYRPGAFSQAPPEELGKLVAEPVDEILENIDRVRDAINDDDLKVWNMHDIVRITQERLDVDQEILLAAIETRVRDIESDESFMSWVVAALAITTSIVAGLLFTPAAGAAVAAAWGTAALVGSIDTYLDESAAENIALDESVADLSINEPQLGWVILDAAFLALDLGMVARALRPAARLLTSAADGLALRVFRRRAVAELGEEAGDQLARRAAARFGIDAAAELSAEAQLAGARTVLGGLDLPDEAIARILAKGGQVEQVKGQLLEELMHSDVARRLASGGDGVLREGTEAAGVELIEGHRIADAAGRQLTDGMLVRRLPDGSLEIVTVLEAKAGRAAAGELRSISEGIGDAEEFCRYMIEEAKGDVVRVLRANDLADDLAKVARGSVDLSEEAIAAVAKDPKLRKTVVQAELGGQFRRDVERLAPGVSDDMSAAGHIDEVPTEILVDGVPTRVRISPNNTHFVGAVPSDVPTAGVSRAMAADNLSFEPMVDPADRSRHGHLGRAAVPVGGARRVSPRRRVAGCRRSSPRTWSSSSRTDPGRAPSAATGTAG